MRSEDKDIIAGKYNILIIDDNPDMLLFLQSSLKDIYNIFPANSGKNALQRLKNIPQLDFILLNVNIHDMDGYELLVSLSGSEEYGDIPIVLLSTKSSTKGSVSDKIKGLSGGAVDYISMPVVIEELIVKIKSIITFREKCLDSYNKRIETEIIKSIKNIDIEKRTKQLSIENIYTKYGVTIREREIIELLCMGLINKEISNRLHVSKRTVEFHIYNIYNKFKINSRMELVKLIKNEE